MPSLMVLRIYEEEFAFVRAFDWSKDSKKLAYIRFDESQVPEFSMSMFNRICTLRSKRLNTQKRREFSSFITYI
jgi:hypothetical protein